MAYKLPFGPLGKLARRLGAEKRAIDEAEQALLGWPARPVIPPPFR